MADLYASADGYVSTAEMNWASARDATGGTTVNDSLGKSGISMTVDAVAAGRGTNYSITRTFMHFDTSGISGNVSGAKLWVRGFSTNAASVIAVKSTAFGGDGGTALATGDIDAITGFSTGASLAGNATVYSSNTFLTTGWSLIAYNNLGSSADLRSDMQTQDDVIICLMDYTNDYLNVTPGSQGTLSSGMSYTEGPGTSKDPYLYYVEDAASGYTHDVMGVATANIGKVINVATANIGKVIGV